MIIVARRHNVRRNAPTVVILTTDRRHAVFPCLSRNYSPSVGRVVSEDVSFETVGSPDDRDTLGN